MLMIKGVVPYVNFLQERDGGLNRRQIVPLGHNCYLDLDKEILVKDNLPIALSRVQFRVLHCLADKLGQPVFSHELTAYAWGSEAFTSRNDLYVYINRLRQRLEDNPKQPQCLLSLRGLGYILYPRKDARS